MTFHDNLGKVLATLFRAPTTGAKTVTGLLRADGGGTFSTSVYQNSTISDFMWLVTHQLVQVGKGSSTPTRQDVTIESPFTVAPEQSPFGNLGRAYNSGLGLITIPASLTNLGGAGAVSEFVKFVSIRDLIGASTNRIVLWARDTFQGVNFIAGETINTDWEIQI